MSEKEVRGGEKERKKEIKSKLLKFGTQLFWFITIPYTIKNAYIKPKSKQ